MKYLQQKRMNRDPLTLLANYHNALKRVLINLLEKNPVKFNIIMSITMIRKDKNGVKERVTGYFQGSTRTLLRSSLISEMLDASAQKINQSFDEYLRNGSGFILETIDYYTAEYIPMRAKSYIPTPKSIINSKSIINIENQDETVLITQLLLLSIIQRLTNITVIDLDNT